MRPLRDLTVGCLILVVFVLSGCDGDLLGKGDDASPHYGDQGSIDDGSSADGDTDADGDADYWSGDTGYMGEAIDDDNAGDKFEDVGSNPFVYVAHDPFSTFAADVDSASYDIFRQYINSGWLPDASSVRIEEYVNYFTYDYPAPDSTDEHPFSITLAAAPDLFGNDTTLFRVGIQGELPPESEKKPANVVFLVDVSGSMSSEIAMVRYLLKEALNVLDDEDTVSIVTYASGVQVRLEPTPVAQRSVIEAKIDGLLSGGATSGGAGITLAYEQAQAGFIEDGINTIILCTDGDFNVGPSSDAALEELIIEKRETGVYLTVLGFGSGNLNDSMMEKLSNAGNGTYAVISSMGQAADFAEKRLLSSLVIIAKDMKIQVEFNPEQVLAYRLIGYENRAIADDDFRDDTVDGGEIGAGHRVTALYELVLAGGQMPAAEGAPDALDGDPVEGEREVVASDMVLVKVRYKDVDATTEDPAYEVAQTMELGDVAVTYDGADEAFKWAAAVATFAEILGQSPYSNLEALFAVEEIIKEETWLDPDRAEFVLLFDKAKPLLTP